MSYRFLFILSFFLSTLQVLAVDTVTENAAHITINFEEGTTMQQGDLNGDGKVNIGDVTFLINKLLNTDENGDSPVVDVDGNGQMNIVDVAKLIDIILSLPSAQLYSTILITTTDGITMEYLLNDDSRLMILKPDFVIETDGMMMTYGLANIVQLRYGQMTVSNELLLQNDLEMPSAGTIFLHGLKENDLTEVACADGRIVKIMQGNDNVKLSLDNEPSGEYVVKAGSQIIKIVKR